MSFNLYVYAPTEGVEYLEVIKLSDIQAGGSGEIVYPAGTGTPCYSNAAILDGETVGVIAHLSDGYQFSHWVVNEDGTVHNEGTTGAWEAAISYSHTGASSVYIRLVVEAISTYYATLEFDANGGSGAPSSMTNSNTGSATVTFTIPYTTPTKTGHAFTGWLLTYIGGSSVYQPGGTANVQGNTDGITYTLYAMWEENSGGARIYSNGWQSSFAHIYDNGWNKAIPYIWTSDGWKKCT